MPQTIISRKASVKNFLSNPSGPLLASSEQSKKSRENACTSEYFPMNSRAKRDRNFVENPPPIEIMASFIFVS